MEGRTRPCGGGSGGASSNSTECIVMSAYPSVHTCADLFDACTGASFPTIILDHRDCTIMPSYHFSDLIPIVPSKLFVSKKEYRQRNVRVPDRDGLDTHSWRRLSGTQRPECTLLGLGNDAATFSSRSLLIIVPPSSAVPWSMRTQSPLSPPSAVPDVSLVLRSLGCMHIQTQPMKVNLPDVWRQYRHEGRGCQFGAILVEVS